MIPASFSTSPIAPTESWFSFVGTCMSGYVAELIQVRNNGQNYKQ